MKLSSIQESKLFAKGETITLTVFPNINAMISGVAVIHHKHPKYLIEYVDHTAEEAICDNMKEDDSMYKMVQTIQDASRLKKTRIHKH